MASESNTSAKRHARGNGESTEALIERKVGIAEGDAREARTFRPWGYLGNGLLGGFGGYFAAAAAYGGLVIKGLFDLRNMLRTDPQFRQKVDILNDHGNGKSETELLSEIISGAEYYKKKHPLTAELLQRPKTIVYSGAAAGLTAAVYGHAKKREKRLDAAEAELHELKQIQSDWKGLISAAESKETDESIQRG